MIKTKSPEKRSEKPSAKKIKKNNRRKITSTKDIKNIIKNSQPKKVVS